uniref:Uncharacterized protein n=1 Tax=Manihot esculenta TaxID=3983 RepID=A0A2C9UBQ1_MANES
MGLLRQKQHFLNVLKDLGNITCLISDTWVNGPLDIKVIFYGGGSATVACYWGSLALSVRCTTALAWRTPPIPISRFQSGRSAAFVLKCMS